MNDTVVDLDLLSTLLRQLFTVEVGDLIHSICSSTLREVGSAERNPKRPIWDEMADLVSSCRSVFLLPPMSFRPHAQLIDSFLLLQRQTFRRDGGIPFWRETGPSLACVPQELLPQVLQKALGLFRDVGPATRAPKVERAGRALLSSIEDMSLPRDAKTCLERFVRQVVAVLEAQSIAHVSALSVRTALDSQASPEERLEDNTGRPAAMNPRQVILSQITTVCACSDEGKREQAALRAAVAFSASFPATEDERHSVYAALMGAGHTDLDERIAKVLGEQPTFYLHLADRCRRGCFGWETRELDLEGMSLQWTVLGRELVI